MSYSYCNNYLCVVNTLEKYLFGKNPNNVLQERYEQMRSRYQVGYKPGDQCVGYNINSGYDKKDRKLNDALLEVPVSDFSDLDKHLGNQSNNYFNLGHDLPFWIELDEPKGRIMLVSQDPLRANQGQGIITLSTPFGMHSPAYRNYGHHRTFTQIVERLVIMGYSVYLTDCRKLFGTNNISDHKSCIKNRVLDADILREEINFFRPCKVVALGRQAWRVLNNELKQNPVYVPHPTGAHINTGKGQKVDYFVNAIINAKP